MMSEAPLGTDERCLPGRSVTVAPKPCDPAELLTQLRADRRQMAWEPLAPERRRQFHSDDLPRTKEALDHLHRHWVLPDSPSSDRGSGARGLVMHVVGRLVFRVLGPYLREEREFLSHLVRLNDALVKECDELARRCQELADRAVDRQLAEAANLTELAAWIDATIGDRSQNADGEASPVHVPSSRASNLGSGVTGQTGSKNGSKASTE